MKSPKQRPRGKPESTAPRESDENRSPSEIGLSFHDVFEAAPIGIWLEDWSAVRREVWLLQERGISDITAYLLEHPDVVYALDQGMKVIDFNEAAANMLGAPDKQTVWDNMDELSIQSYEDIRIYAELIGGFAAGRTRAVGEGWIGCYRDRRVYSRDSAAIAPDRLDDWSRVIHSKEDITEEHRFRKELRDQNKMLVQANEERERANAAKTEFLANVSHDLRTPINAVKLYSEILRDDLADLGRVEMIDDIDKILYVSAHQLDLINQLLDMAKIEAGELVLDESDFEIAKITDACLVMIHKQAENDGIVLESSSADPTLWLRADQLKIKQILINLLRNAIKFTPQGDTVRLEVSVAPGGGVGFQISDTGVGIALEDIPKALENFGQINGNGSRYMSGTGLGLPIAVALAEAHGGVLEIESTVGEGTAVTMTLPRERVLSPDE